jgi:hypothetical protein
MRLKDCSQAHLDFLFEELNRRQEVITRICELQNLASAAGYVALAGLPFKMEADAASLFQSSLSLIQDATFRLTEPYEPRS